MSDSAEHAQSRRTELPDEQAQPHAPVLQGRFLARRARLAADRAALTVGDSVQRIATVVSHAETLADRVEALPPLTDGDLSERRRARVAQLRWAVRAGEEMLRRQAEHDQEPSVARRARQDSNLRPRT